MSYHVFAVWDFMCLLKTLYARLVCVDAPWSPPKDPLSAHLIGDIIQEEESDITDDGRYLSHYDMYLEAMTEIGATTEPIQQFLHGVSCQKPHDWINQSRLPQATKDFLQSTFDSFKASTHGLAAAFVFGREDLTAVMFKPLIRTITIETKRIQPASKLLSYLHRHIELDEADHSTKAFTMLSNLCGDHAARWEEATQAAYRALVARNKFFTAIHQSIVTAEHVLPVDKLDASSQASFSRHSESLC